MEEKGKRVRLKLAEEKERGCYHKVYRPQVELDLWVNRKNLEQVTTSPLSWTFKDGSEVELAAGIVVKSGKVIVNGVSMSLDIPKNKLGYSFKKKYLVEKKPKTRIGRFETKKGIKFDSDKYYSGKVFYNVEKIGNRYEIRNKCVRVRGQLEGEAKPSKGGGGGFGYGIPKGKKAVPPGTIVYTKKHKEIGKVVTKIVGRESDKIVGKYRCLSLSILGTQKEVCVLRSSVVTTPLTKVLGGSGYGYGSGSVDGLGNIKGTSFGSIGRLKNSKRPRGVFKYGKIKTSGDAVVLKDILRKRRNVFKYCYEKQLGKNPTLRGNILIRIKIGANGRVKTTTLLKSTMKSSEVEGCLFARIKGIRFASSKKETKIDLPFIFSLKKKDNSQLTDEK